MTANKRYTIEEFHTGARHAVEAQDPFTALESQTVSCFTVVRKPDNRFAAITLENEVFTLPGEVVAETATAAAMAMRERYRELVFR